MNTPEHLKDLDWIVEDKDLMEEFFFFLDHKGKLSLRTNHNTIIKFFQQDNFYRVEKEMWENPKVREKLINNRCLYLNKTPEELTVYDILSGFKKSAMYYGYSGFNPLLAKWFFEKYNINTCYDPCGGWGHRALGATELDLYIYNDLSTHTWQQVNDMRDYFNLYNVITYNKDARSFIPKEEFESMFTCPPYYNLESYECGYFCCREEYDDFIDSLFNVFNKSNAKIFGMVIREDLLGNHNDWVERFNLKNNTPNHLCKNSKHKYKEYLYVWKKELE